MIGTVESNSWVGIVDAYTQLEEGNKLGELTWDVTCEITKAVAADPIKVYHFSVDKLNKKVFSAKGGMYIRQCVYALWLEDCMGGMQKLDNKAAELYERIKVKGAGHQHQILDNNDEPFTQKTNSKKGKKKPLQG